MCRMMTKYEEIELMSSSIRTLPVLLVLFRFDRNSETWISGDLRCEGAQS